MFERSKHDKNYIYHTGGRVLTNEGPPLFEHLKLHSAILNGQRETLQYSLM